LLERVHIFRIALRELIEVFRRLFHLTLLLDSDDQSARSTRAAATEPDATNALPAFDRQTARLPRRHAAEQIAHVAEAFAQQDAGRSCLKEHASRTNRAGTSVTPAGSGPPGSAPARRDGPRGCRAAPTATATRS